MKIVSLNVTDSKRKKIVKGKIKKFFMKEPRFKEAFLANFDNIVFPFIDNLITNDAGISGGLYVWAVEKVLDYFDIAFYDNSDIWGDPGEELSEKDVVNLFDYLEVPASVAREKLVAVRDWVSNVPSAVNDIQTMDLADAEAVAEAWHRSLTFTELSDDRSYEKGLKVIKQYPDGYYWIDLNCTSPSRTRTQREQDIDNNNFSQWNQCDYEAEMMGHCGLSAGHLISLRNKGHAHLTASVDFESGVLYQLKAKGNSKPPIRYHKYIMDLLLDPAAGLKVYNPEYKKEADFNVLDLNSEAFNNFRKENEALTYSFIDNGSSYNIKNAYERGVLTEDDLYILFIEPERYRGDYIVQLFKKELLTSEMVQAHFDQHMGSLWSLSAIVSGVTLKALPKTAFQVFYNTYPNYEGWTDDVVEFVVTLGGLDSESIRNIVLKPYFQHNFNLIVLLLQKNILSQSDFIEIYSERHFRYNLLVNTFYDEGVITKDTLAQCLRGENIHYELFGIYRYLYSEKIFTLPEIKDMMLSRPDADDWMDIGYTAEDYPFAVLFEIMDRDTAERFIEKDVHELTSEEFKNLVKYELIQKDVGVEKLSMNGALSFTEIYELYTEKLINSDDLSKLVETLDYYGGEDSGKLLDTAVNDVISKESARAFIKNNESEFTVGRIIYAFLNDIVSTRYMSQWLGDKDLSIRKGYFRYNIGYLWGSDIKEWFSRHDQDIIGSMIDSQYLDYFYSGDEDAEIYFDYLDDESIKELKMLLVERDVILSNVAAKLTNHDLKELLYTSDDIEGFSFNEEHLLSISEEISLAIRSAVADVYADAYAINIKNLYIEYLEEGVFSKLTRKKEGTYVGYIDPQMLVDSGLAYDHELVIDVLLEMFEDSTIFDDYSLNNYHHLFNDSFFNEMFRERLGEVGYN